MMNAMLNCGQRSDFAYKQKAIKIIADEHVEKEFGTGVVKLLPLMT